MPSIEILQPVYDHWGIAFSVLIAVLSSYVSLDLARRVHRRDVYVRAFWTVGGGIVMGTGIWAMHFVGMLATQLPMDIGYDRLVTLLSWVAGVSTSALALFISSRSRLTWRLLWSGAIVMGAGICTMHYLGMAALVLAPGIVWNAALVLLSVLVAIAASAVALSIYFRMRRLSGRKAQLAQGGAALVMGLAISGMHYIGEAAANYPTNAECFSAQDLHGPGFRNLVILICLVLLLLTLFAAKVDDRMRAQAARVSAALEVTSASLNGAHAELERLAMTDALTGVSNRMLFQDRLGDALARLEQGTISRIGVLFIDLDGFKPVNDSYGHAVGDALLQQIAARLKGVVRDVDTLARIGGDEFVLLLDDVAGEDDVTQVALRILETVSSPYEVDARPVSLSCSVGAVVYPDHGGRDRIVADADAAMYVAKNAGGNGFALFRQHMHEDVSEQVELRQALREAIDQGQLQLYYQPKLDGRTGQVNGVEALLRWVHPVRGLISPGVFIPIAERFGLINRIGAWVIDEACRQIAWWQARGSKVRVAVNLSSHQLRSASIVDDVRQALERHRVDPGQLACEITESIAMEHSQASKGIIERLSTMGVQVSIDDFGTGYSSLSSLRQMHVSELKIDREFVMDVAKNKDARAIVDAIVRLAHALDLRVVAEGVETSEQRDALIELGCDELQGFFLGRPMPALDLMKRGLPVDDALCPAAEGRSSKDGNVVTAMAD
jgi:diguanylate cyclase (GGDEF)-like protein